MAHMRTQIRTAFKSALDAALPTEYVVFAGRRYSRNHVAGEAMVDMRFLDDQTSEREVMGDARIHVASLYIRVQRSEAEELLDDSLDVDEVRIVAAVEAADWTSLLEEPPELIQVNFADDAETGRALGAIVLRYDVEYRIDKADPETSIE
jgi:hypothetical protein